MTTLVTGAGLIGSLTARMLLERGERVVIADMRRTDMSERPGLLVETCDVTDAAALDGLIARHGIRRVVHTAAMLSTGIRQNPARGVEVNVMGTVNVLEAARRHALTRVVIASSTTVGYAAFGHHGPEPIEEDVPLHVVSQRPGSVYAATKLAGEHLALLYNDLYGLDVIVLRYAGVLGGGSEPPTSVPGRLLARLVEAGRSGVTVVLDDPLLMWGGREEFVDARDCAHANVCALNAVDRVQNVFNIAPGTWFTLGEFIATARRVMPDLNAEWPADIGYGFAGFPHLRPAPSAIEAARRDLDFTCRLSLEDSIRHWI